MKYLKRFFKEVYNNEDMYNEYLEGRVFIDNEKLMKWFKDVEIRNKTFAEAINKFAHPNNSQKVFETSISETLSVSSKMFNKKEIEIGDFERFKICKKELGNSRNLYICNGWYSDTLDNIYQVLNKGCFAVGICCEKKTDLFRDVRTHYNKLKDFLLKNGYNAGSIEENTYSNNRVYLLTYDSFRQRRR